MNGDESKFIYTDDTLDEAIEVPETGLFRSPTRFPFDRFDISEAFEPLTQFLGICLPAAIRFNELVHNCYLCVQLGEDLERFERVSSSYYQRYRKSLWVPSESNCFEYKLTKQQLFVYIFGRRKPRLCFQNLELLLWCPGIR